MLSDLLATLGRGFFDQLTYWRHTYSPLSPWRARCAATSEQLTAEAAKYGARSRLDPRRVYQLARGLVLSRRGEALVNLVPDAYLVFSPPSAATFHNGKRSYAAPADRRIAFLQHPQTLAYALTPPKLSRLGVGASPTGGLVVVGAGESVNTETVVARLQKLVDGKASDADLRAYAEVLVRLDAGIPVAEPAAGPEPEAAAA